MSTPEPPDGSGLPDPQSGARGPESEAQRPQANASGPQAEAQHPQPNPPEPRHRIRYVGRTDTGLLRGNNEDSFAVGPRALVVADGMGGHAAGEVASKLVADAFAPLNQGPPEPDLLTAITNAVQEGNAAITRTVTLNPQLAGMGTTVTALLFDGPYVALAHVGDSRGYLYRNSVLHQLTHDDTFVQSLVDEGRITEDQAHDHPQRNLVLRALNGEHVEPAVTVREAQIGDRYLLCSDGLCGVVSAEAIADGLAIEDAGEAADALIELALAAGGPDNITVVVVDVQDTGVDLSATAPIARPAASQDPSATNPMTQLTRELPRVPLPPIPEEPGAPAHYVDPGEDADDARDDYDEPAEYDGAAEYDTADFDGTDYDEHPDYDGRSGYDGKPPTAPAGDTDESGERARQRSDREADAEDAESSKKPPRRRRRMRRLIASVTVLAVLVGVITGATLWVRNQYYVSDQGNLVVIFRGVDGSLLGWSFSTFEETSCAGHTDCTPLRVTDLVPAAQNQVRAGIKASSLDNARTVVARLEDQILPLCTDEEAPEGNDVIPPASTTATTGSTARPGGPAHSRSSRTPDTAAPDSAAPTPLAPAAQVPGVTCRTAP